MNLSVEISCYPLQNDYITIIGDYLKVINALDLDIEIRSCNMSTRIFGSYDDVMSCLNQSMKHSMQKYGKMVFICKFLQGDARDLEGYN